MVTNTEIYKWSEYSEWSIFITIPWLQGLGIIMEVVAERV